MSEIINQTNKLNSIDNIITNIENNQNVSNKNKKNDDILNILLQISDPIERVKADLRYRHIYGYRLVSVPSNYYNCSLDQRSNMLCCHKEQLCKSIVMENTSYIPPTNSGNTNTNEDFDIVLYYNIHQN